MILVAAEPRFVAMSYFAMS